MPESRRHIAVMFTDIAGYTRLMGSDEEKAFDVLRKNREIHAKYISQFKGTLIKEMGDGMLISFDLASEGVRCAIEIQQACKKQDIPLKIGIHEGEVIFEGNDVLGDGVNIASRIQDQALEGYILVSGSIFRDIKNKKEIRSEYVGEIQLKNVDEPMKVYAVCYDGCPDTKVIGRRLSMQSSPYKSFFRRTVVRISGLLIALIAFTIFFLFYQGTTIPFEERDWIVVSDFENLTGQQVFDHSLNTAFVLSINQSRYVNVINRKRMHETLRRMEKQGISNIDEAMAREIAVREGVKICVVPGISKVGDQYVLTSKIQDAASGDVLKSAVLYADDQNDILHSLDQLSRRMRRELGEPRFEIYSQSKPLSKVTTTSLDALKEFSLGIQDHTDMNFDLARMHYKNAISLDSNFVAAKASLGNLLYERFDAEAGQKWLNEAMKGIDHLTEREKYGILAFYAVNVEKDLDKGIEYTLSCLDLYPDDATARNNLGWYYQNSGQFEKAAEQYKEAIQINPYLMLPYGGLVWIQLDNLARLDSAKKWSKKMIEKDPQNPWGYAYLASAYVGNDQLDSALINYQKSIEINPKLLYSQYRLSYVYRILGQYDKSMEVLNHIQSLVPGEVAVHYQKGLIYKSEGNLTMARECFEDFLEKAEKWKADYSDHPSTYTSIGAAWAQKGEIQMSIEIAEKAFELDSTSYFNYAVLLSAQGRKHGALDYLEKALKNGYRNIVWIKLNPDLDAIRQEPRFVDLMTKYFEHVNK